MQDESQIVVDSVAVRNVAVNRDAAADVDMAVPPGCTLRCYDRKGGRGNSYWECKLPGQALVCSVDSTAPRHSRRRDFREGLRTKDEARRECVDWLYDAMNAGVF